VSANVARGYSIGAPDPAADLAALAELVEAYRVFYGCAPAPVESDAFVRERLARGDTRFFVARDAASAVVGFAHLVPATDTLALRTIGILEDIFVAEAHRRAGLGGALLDAAEAYARERGYSRLTLSTAHRNYTAQRLYLAHGYVPDQRFRSFNRVLDESPS
jgi:GNAT superfamily N-acetyltransferase